MKLLDVVNMDMCVFAVVTNGHAAAETVAIVTKPVAVRAKPVAMTKKPVVDEQKQQADRAAGLELLRRQMEEEKERRRALIAEVSLCFIAHFCLII